MAANWERAARQVRDVQTRAQRSGGWRAAHEEARAIWRETPGYEHLAEGIQLSRAQAGNVPQHILNLINNARAREFWGADPALAGGGGPGGGDGGGGPGGGGGGGGDSTFVAATQHMLTRFSTPYVAWQALSGGLPGQDAAATTAFATDRLLRSTGAAKDTFDDLADSISHLAGVSDITKDRFSEMALAVAKTAGKVTAQEAMQTAEEAVQAGRGFGLEDQVMPQWLAEMRWQEAGVTKDLLPLIGAAVAKAQMPGRSEELLRGILGHTEKMQAQLGRGIDVTQYADTVASMSGFAAENQYPGMKGQGSMSMLERMDAAFANPDSEAKELFWSEFLESKGITDAAAQKTFRAGGLSSHPDLLREIPEFLEKRRGTTKAAGKDYTTLSIANLLGIPIGQAQFFEDWVARGGKGLASDLPNWLKGRGFSTDLLKPGTVADVGDLFAVATSEAARKGDYSGLKGLGARYLTEEERAALGPGPNEKWVDALLKKLVQGRDDTDADANRARITAASNALQAGGELVNKGANIFADAVQSYALATDALNRWLNEKFGLDLPTMSDEEREAARKAWERTHKRGEAVTGAAGAVIGAKDWVGSMFGSGSVGADTIPLTGVKLSEADTARVARVMGYRDMVVEEATKEGVDPAWALGMMHQESGGNPNAVSSAGAEGLMQLMPDTARAYGVKDAFDPRDNVRGGVKYMKDLLKRYGGMRYATAAYNAGETKVDKFGGEHRLAKWQETKTHNRRVHEMTSVYTNLLKPPPKPTETPAGPPKPATTPAGSPEPPKVPADGLGADPTTGLWGWPRGVNGVGEGRMMPGPQMPFQATIEVVQRTDTGEIAQRDTRRLVGASFPTPAHLAPSYHATAHA